MSNDINLRPLSSSNVKKEIPDISHLRDVYGHGTDEWITEVGEILDIHKDAIKYLIGIGISDERWHEIIPARDIFIDGMYGLVALFKINKYTLGTTTQFGPADGMRLNLMFMGWIE